VIDRQNEEFVTNYTNFAKGEIRFIREIRDRNRISYLANDD